jgi:uncharacterized protein YbaR (Trm112 family)
MIGERITNVLDKLRCPECRSDAGLETSGERLRCSHCVQEYTIANGVPILFTGESREDAERELSTSTGEGMKNEYQRLAEQRPGLLRRLVKLVRPPELMYHYNPGMRNESTKPVFNHAGDDTFVLNVGGGPGRYSEHEITLNLRPFSNVDLVGDAHNIPLKSGTVDSVICNAVLEHVYDPETVVSEILRVLKPGGILYAEVPYIFFFHGYPNDFKRYTKEGMRRLFAGLADAEIGMTNGPVSAVLQSVNIMLNILFPLQKAYALKPLNGVFRWLVFYFKYLDILLERKPDAHKLAGGFYVLGRKAE